MSKILQAEGLYKAPDTKEEIKYSFSYTVIDSIADAVEALTEEKCKSLIQRQLKVDANNIAREKAKSANGHSSRQPLTEEQKGVNKAKRAETKDIMAFLASKGMSLEDLKDSV